MNISPGFVTLPLASPENTIGKLIDEIRFQEKQSVFAIKAGGQQQAATRNLFIEEIKQEILKRFEELNEKLQRSEANSRRRIGQKFDGPVEGQAGEAD